MNPGFFFFFKENLYIDNTTKQLPVEAGGIMELLGVLHPASPLLTFCLGRYGRAALLPDPPGWPTPWYPPEITSSPPAPGCPLLPALPAPCRHKPSVEPPALEPCPLQADLLFPLAFTCPGNSRITRI